MTPFSPFFLLIGGLSLSLQASAQGSSFINGSLAARPPAPSTSLFTVAGPARHSSQLPAEGRDSAPALAEAAAPANSSATSSSATSPGAAGTGKSQLLLVLLETLQAQQAQIAALRAQADAATRRASEAEAATVAFEQRLRQLEAAGGRPSFWR